MKDDERRQKCWWWRLWSFMLNNKIWYLSWTEPFRVSFVYFIVGFFFSLFFSRSISFPIRFWSWSFCILWMQEEKRTMNNWKQMKIESKIIFKYWKFWLILKKLHRFVEFLIFFPIKSLNCYYSRRLVVVWNWNWLI